MIESGTNASARYITHDDSKQAALATKTIQRLSAQAGCEQTMTFDRAAAKSGGMALIA